MEKIIDKICLNNKPYLKRYRVISFLIHGNISYVDYFLYKIYFVVELELQCYIFTLFSLNMSL